MLGATPRIGIDLGGSKIATGVLAATGTERCRRRVPAPQGDYEATLDLVAGLVRGAQSKPDAPGSSQTVFGAAWLGPENNTATAEAQRA